MNITQWLSRLSDFVNLGNLVTNTTAGTVLAIALALVASDIAQLPILTAPVEGLRYQQRLKVIKGEISDQTKEFAGASAKESKAQQVVSDAAAEVAHIQTALDAYLQEDRKRDSEDILRANRIPNKIQKLKEDLQKAQTVHASALGEQAAATLQKEEEETFLKELYDRRARVRAEEVNTLSDLFTLSINHMVALLLVGWLVGTLINPISHALFLSGEPPLLALLNMLFGEPETSKEEDQQAAWNSYLEKGLEALNRADAVNLARHYPTNYFVGLNIIGQSELDALEAKHFRWLQLAAQLILPTAALFGSVFWAQGIAWWGLWLAAGALLAGCGLLLYGPIWRAKRDAAAELKAKCREAERREAELGFKRVAHSDAPKRMREPEPNEFVWLVSCFGVLVLLFVVVVVFAPLFGLEETGPWRIFLMALAGWGAWMLVWALHLLVRRRRSFYKDTRRFLVESRLLHLIRAARAEKKKKHDLIVRLEAIATKIEELVKPL